MGHVHNSTVQRPMTKIIEVKNTLPLSHLHAGFVPRDEETRKDNPGIASHELGHVATFEEAERKSSDGKPVENPLACSSQQNLLDLPQSAGVWRSAMDIAVAAVAVATLRLRLCLGFGSAAWLWLWVWMRLLTSASTSTSTAIAHSLT